MNVLRELVSPKEGRVQETFERVTSKGGADCRGIR